VTITDAAQCKVDKTLNGEGFLGISLEGGGCSGYQIKLNPQVDLPSDAKMLSETIFSDEVSLSLLGDAVMDWNDDPFHPSFNFTPPTGASSCGCGNSFTI
jgi:iron-sulfur cluster assembly accessory protein